MSRAMIATSQCRRISDRLCSKCVVAFLDSLSERIRVAFLLSRIGEWAHKLARSSVPKHEEDAV